MNDDQNVFGDVESGSIDSGLAENVIVQTAENARIKSRREDVYDPKSDINSSGVGVMKLED